MMENIRPIRTEKDYDWALGEIARYFDDQPEIGSRAADRFDVLAALIEDYENRHYPISTPDPVSAIQAHMQMANLKQTALAEILGSRSRASEVLSRKRALTLDMAYKINKAWKIPAEILVQPYHLSSR
jgi:HTH-type transcriptional regulator/antitoxin HigA